MWANPKVNIMVNYPNMLLKNHASSYNYMYMILATLPNLMLAKVICYTV